MASGFIGNEVPRKGLRVRSPCPPLRKFLSTRDTVSVPFVLLGDWAIAESNGSGLFDGKE